MAKMFYTLEEVQAKLGKTETQIKDMVRSGQIQEFRDRDKLMFKREQIDLLAGGEEDTGDVPLQLEDSDAGGSGLGLSGSGVNLKNEGPLGLADSREGTGVSVFDTGHGGEDGAGDTQVGDAVDELSLESVGSGSGLLDLTRESDDTSLGAELLEEVYSSDDKAELPAHATGLFEAAGAESPGNAVADGAIGMPMFVEVYDGSGSGLGVGLLLGAMVSMICLAVIAIASIGGATPALAQTMAGNIWMWTGILAGVTLVCGLIGFFIGKASE